MEFFLLGAVGTAVVLGWLLFLRLRENYRVNRADRYVRKTAAAYPVLSTDPGPLDITYAVGDVNVTEYHRGAYSLEAAPGSTIPVQTLREVVPHDLLAEMFGPKGFGSR